jgi:hypothetical protein
MVTSLANRRPLAAASTSSLPALVALCLSAALLPACGDNLSPARDGPFAPQPDTSEGLTNVSADLDAVLENGALEGACERYRGGERDRRTKLLCGKSMFFDESFDTGGVPAALVDHLVADYPEQVGAGFERLGMVRDPRSEGGLPLGLAPTIPLGPEGEIPAYAFTCASCHFARLPDGRYAVGAPNHDYDYGGQILALAVYPLVAIGASDESDHAPEVIERIRGLLERHESDAGVRGRLLEAVLPLAAIDGSGLTPDIERHYASWPTGTQDFIIPPLPLDDEIHIVSKIIDLWAIPSSAEIEAAAPPHAMLAWTGAARSLADFVAGFAVVGGQEPWSSEELEPLVEYIESLRAPENPAPPDAARVRAGEQLFAARGCLACHDAPRGGGDRIFDLAEIGTDVAMARWLDADGDGEPCCGVELSAPLTGGIKSPRLTGMWAKRRFLHNGSLSSLEQLFCLDGPRPGIVEPPHADGGHEMTCDLARDEKLSLISYLLSH